jgi:putative transposase
MIGDFAHVFNRGVEKRKIFLDEKDYLRFVSNLFLLNNKSGKLRTERKNIFSEPRSLLKQEKLVEILKWSLLPNHYHLLLEEKIEGGILEFTKRLGNAYTKYFNTKNKGRSGYLFQNSAKIIPIDNDRQFLYIPLYIDLNPLDLIYPDWVNNNVFNKEKALDFLRSYRWSSFADYFSERDFSSIVNRELFYDLFDTDHKKYQSELGGFLKEPIGIDI